MAYQSRETKLGRNVKRNNLRVDGISESRNETWEECKEEIQKVFNESFVLKMFKLKEHIVQRGTKVTTIVENQEQ